MSPTIHVVQDDKEFLTAMHPACAVAYAAARAAEGVGVDHRPAPWWDEDIDCEWCEKPVLSGEVV